MAALTNESSGGRRNLNAELNLVPFIDLLSMCICFLLMTAVWVQIGSMQIKQSHGTEAAPNGGFAIDLQFTGPTSLALVLNKGGKVQKKVQLVAANFSELMTALDGKLKDLIAALAPAVKDPSVNSQLISSALVTPFPRVSYGSLISAMDVLRKNQIHNLGVVPAGGSN